MFCCGLGEGGRKEMEGGVKGRGETERREGETERREGREGGEVDSWVGAADM